MGFPFEAELEGSSLPIRQEMFDMWILTMSVFVSCCYLVDRFFHTGIVVATLTVCCQLREDVALMYTVRI